MLKNSFRHCLRDATSLTEGGFSSRKQQKAPSLRGLSSECETGGVHTPVKSKLGVYSSFALLFCCM